MNQPKKMNDAKQTFKRLLLAAAICMPLAAFADSGAPMPPDADSQDGRPMGGRGMADGPGMPMHGHSGRPPRGGHGGPGEGGARFLRGIELNEQQQDKVFAIMHAQAPELRDQHKIVAKSREALHALSTSGKYDDAKAVALTQAAAQAMARITLDQVRTKQQILAILTPEQRQKVAQREQHMMEGRERPGHSGPPQRPQ
ncbi:MAG TPA: Spy/CpxP family protein refolding chaperone [Janthinobacterium sp.]|jgi:Spy/CpxP family protein refolding chaperone|nr:Spy/CpxP family protein refolding chaperone [Janthinobacterium sp.]